MHHYSDIPITVDQQVSEFMEELHERTGVGPDFLNVIRPAVYRMFRTVDVLDLRDAKNVIVRKAELHMQTLAHLSRTLDHLTRLSDQEKASPALTPEMVRQLEFTRGVVVNTLLKTYGGFGTRAIIRG